MSSKVTNIYIDTYNFCHEDVVRAQSALRVITEHNVTLGVQPQVLYFGKPVVFKPVVFFDKDGQWSCHYPKLPVEGADEVNLQELESIAFRCQQKKENLPTRNIFIDARKLTQEQRRNAFKAINYLKANDTVHCNKPWLGVNGDIDYILFDIFEIEAEGSRYFCSGDKSIKRIFRQPDSSLELTYGQLMTLSGECSSIS